MKKTLFIFLSAFIVTTGYAKTKVFDIPLQVTPLNGLTLDAIHDFIHSKNSPFVVELREGTVVPLKFLMKSQFLSAMLDPNLVLEVEKTCYMLVMNKKCYMSEDLVHWEKVSHFVKGKSVVEIKPDTDKPGLILETTISPDADDDEDEEDF